MLVVLVLQHGAWAQGPPDIVWQVPGHINKVDAVAFSPSGQVVASGAGDEVKLWGAENGTLIDTFAGHAAGVLSVDLSPDGQLMAAGYIVSGYPPGGVMNLWEISAHTVRYDFGGCYVAFSPDGGLIASGGGGVNRYLTLHHVSDGREVFTVYTGAYILDVAYSPDGEIIATAGSDNNINLWDAASGDLLRSLSGHTDDVVSIAFSPNGAILASGAGGWDDPGESTIRLWRVTDGTLIRTVDGHGYWVDAVAYSPKGLFLISGGRDGLTPIGAKIKLWRVPDGKILQYYDEGVSTGIGSIDYSPGGEFYLYGRSDGDVVLAHTPIVETCFIGTVM